MSNLILILLSVAILLVVGRYDINFTDYKSPIPYSNMNDITWSDFKGINKPYYSLYGEKGFAFIVTEMRAEYTQDGRIQVKSYFHPSRSYVYSKRSMDRALLRHELYHFHITEYTSRLVRRELARFPEKMSSGLPSLLMMYRRKEDSLQAEYDGQSRHGYIMKSQKKWESYIDSCLLANAMYQPH